MSDSIRDIQQSDSINCKFSEQVYQKMVTVRYGIQSCCEVNKHVYIDKELLDLNNIMDAQYTIPITVV